MGMKMFILLIEKNVVEQCRDIKRNSFFIILPIAIFICFYSYFQVNEVEVSFVKPMNVGVVLEDDTLFSQMLVDDFENKKDLAQVFVLEQDTLTNLQPKFDNKNLDALIIIPNGFVEALMSFDYLPMEIQINNDDPIKTMILYNGFLGYERYISSVEKGVTSFYNVFRDEVDKDEYWEYNDALSVDLIMTVLSRSEIYEFKPIVDIPSVVSVKYYFIAITVMFIFLLSLFTGLDLLKEVKSQAFSRLLTTRVNMLAYMCSKIVSHVFIIVVIVIIWSTIFSLISGELMFFDHFHIVLLLILLIIISVISGLLMTIFISNEEELLLFSSVFVFFNAIVGGSIIPIHYMPEGLKSIAKITPNYMMIRLFLYLENNIDVNGLLWIELTMMLLIVLGTYFLTKAYEVKMRRGNHG